MSAEIRRVKERYEDLLLGIKGVTGVAVNGSIVVYVDKLTPELRNVLPKSVDGVPIKIKERKWTLLSVMKPLEAVYTNRTNRWRPVPGGVSIGHPLVSAGTFGCAIIDKSRTIVGGLSCNHVLALDWGKIHKGQTGDPVLQPAPYDGGTITDSIGSLARYIPVTSSGDNYVDAAIFESNELRKDILEVGSPSQSIEPRIGMRIVKSGRSSGVSHGTIVALDATLNVSGSEEAGACVFKEQIIVEPSILFPGDSGSWGGQPDTYNTIGLGFAGSFDASAFNSALRIESLLGIKIVPYLYPPIGSISKGIILSILAGTYGLGTVLMRGGKKK